MTDNALKAIAKEWAKIKEQHDEVKGRLRASQDQTRALEQEQQTLKNAEEALFKAASALQGRVIDEDRAGTTAAKEARREMVKDLLAMANGKGKAE